MYISLKWLQGIININKMNLQRLCEKLTLSGFEIDNIIKKQSFNEIDYILDVNITANRGDLFNIIGIAREIVSLSGKPLMKLNSKISEFANWQYFIQDYYFFSQSFNPLKKIPDCSLLFTININNFVIRDSPNWIKKKLLISDFFPTNNIIDISNLILLETGYSFIFYDKNKLQNFIKNHSLNFTTKLTNEKNKITKFINSRNEYQKNNFLKKELFLLSIGLNEIPQILITESTTDIIIQASLFNPKQIRRIKKSSFCLEFKPELSKRLEKELNLNGLETSFIRLIYLLFTQGIKSKNLFRPNPIKINLLNEIKKEFFFQKNEIILYYKSINQILGNLSRKKKINKEKIFTSLNNLKFKILNTNSLSLKFIVPLARSYDIVREIDLLEEMGRIIGFNNFISNLPFSKTYGKLSKLEKLKRQLKNYFLSIGLNEFLNYTINLQEVNFTVKLKNPIGNELTNLRFNLSEILLQKLKFNQNQGNFILNAFEINRIYNYNFKYNLIEQEIISGIFGETNVDSNWQQTKTNLNWFEAKGLLEEIFSNLNINLNWLYDKKKFSSIFYSGQLAHLFFEKKYCGYFGQISTSYAQKLNISKDIYLFELNLGILEKIWQPNYFFSYLNYSIYPKSIVDLSIILPNNISFNQIKYFILQLQDPVLKNIYLFDFYSDSPVPQGYNSFGLKLQFQSIERTLTNSEIEKKIKKIKRELSKNFKIIFRY